MKTRIILALFLCAIAMLTGCKKEETVQMPMLTVNGDNLVLTLEENPTTGYTWNVLYTSDNLEVISAEYVAKESMDGTVGAPGVKKMELRLNSGEEGVLVGAYMRPWKDVRPDKYYAFEIKYDGKEAMMSRVEYDELPEEYGVSK